MLTGGIAVRDRGRVTQVRWFIIGMAFLGTAINYIDRANLSVAEPFIREEGHLSRAQFGFILSGFFWTYALCQLPAGWFVDKWGARRTYTFAAVWWSLFTALTSVARGFWPILACRWLLGAGEAGAYPANAKAAAEWFPKSERGIASAIFDSGSRIGTALSLPIVSLVIHLFGWRVSFLVTGALGVLWAVAWFWLYRHPSEHPWVSRAEVEYIDKGGGRGAHEKMPPGPKLRWRDLFRYRTVIGMAAGFFCLSFVIYFFITWFPTYLREGRGFSSVELGTVGMIPPLVATLGGWGGGLFSDWLVRRGESLTRARKIPILVGMVGSSAIIAAALVEAPMAAVAWLSVSYAGLACAAAGIWSLPADVAPTPAHVSSIGGIQNCASNMAGIILPPLVGILLDRTGNNFVVPLLFAGGVGIVGALIYAFGVGPIERLPVLEKTGHAA